MKQKLIKWYKTNRLDIWIVAALVVLAVGVHAWNGLRYPYFENDEATYIGRGWSFADEGKLDPYTYRYDHAPFGWMMIGTWLKLTGNTALFPSQLVSGRVFMVVVHAISVILLYVIARRFSKNRYAPVIAVLLFTLSPLSIYFQRRVLLDNLMTLWLLVSVFFASRPKPHLLFFQLSGLAFGLAIATKLNAIFVGPAILYLVFAKAHKEHRWYAMVQWLGVAGLTVLFYLLYAVLKGELLSAPLDADGKPTRVSLIDTTVLQLSRGDFALPWNKNSSFYLNLVDWFRKDVVLIVAGAIGAVGALFSYKKNKLNVVASLLVLCFVLFLARGKIVIDLYIVPVLPMLALCAGLFFGNIINYLSTKFTVKAFGTAFMALAVVFYSATYSVSASTLQYHVDETSNQLKAQDWIVKNVDPGSFIAMDNYAFPALKNQHGFGNAHYMFNVEYDPVLRDRLADDFRSIDYILLTHEVVKQMKNGSLPFVKEAYEHSELVASFLDNATSYIDLDNLISSNGDWAQIYRVKSDNEIALQDSWQFYKDRFIVSYGQVIDPENNDRTTSAGQAQAMRRAVAANDKAMFKGLWQWTQDHMQHRATDKLFSWRFEKQSDGQYALADSNTVSFADQEIALALLEAHDKWNDIHFLWAAQEIIPDIWKQEVVAIAGNYYLDSSADGSQDDRLVNTGYLAPASYRWFAQVDTTHPWLQLVDDGYEFIARLQAGTPTGLFPNWTVVGEDGSIATASGLVGPSADNFGQDAARLIPALFTDAKLFSDMRATAILAPLANHFAGLESADKQYVGEYLLDGTGIGKDLNVGMAANAIIAYRSQGMDTQADELYAAEIQPYYRDEEGYWYYDRGLYVQTTLGQLHQLVPDLLR